MEHTPKVRPRRTLEEVVERSLWGSRLIVILAVAASLVVGAGMFYVATVDSVHFVLEVWEYGGLHLGQGDRDNLRLELVSHAIEVIDSYLLGTMMMIFSFGLYELFISRLDSAGDTEQSSRVLLIGTFDDLKDRLAKVVVLILIVKLFEKALQINPAGPKDLLYLAGAIVLVSLALYLSHHKAPHGQE